MRLDYNPEAALQLLMERLSEHAPDLAAHARAAIDAGVDDVATQEIQTGRKRLRTTRREYRKNRPLSTTESIDAVLDVLSAHLITQRRVVNSVMDEFAVAVTGTERRPSRWQAKSEVEVEVSADSRGTSKKMQIELQPEAVRAFTGPEVHDLTRTDEAQLNELLVLLDEVKRLTTFEEAEHGDAS